MHSCTDKASPVGWQMKSLSLLQDLKLRFAGLSARNPPDPHCYTSEMFGLLKQPWLIQPGPVETLVDSTINQESARK